MAIRTLPPEKPLNGMMSLVLGWEHLGANMWLNFVERQFPDGIE